MIVMLNEEATTLEYECWLISTTYSKYLYLG